MTTGWLVPSSACSDYITEDDNLYLAALTVKEDGTHNVLAPGNVPPSMALQLLPQCTVSAVSPI